jgi:hypothetical protein
LDLTPRNHGPGKRGSQEIAIFKDGIALNSSEDELLDEDPPEIYNDHALSA